MSIVGLDARLVTELVRQLGAAADQADGLRHGIARIGALAEDAAARAGYSADSGEGAPDSKALQVITQEATLMATEVKTRLAHLLACEADGLPISDELFFSDEPPPSPANVAAAISYFRDHVKEPGSDGLQLVLGDWVQLTPPEIDAVLNKLTPADLDELNSRLRMLPTDEFRSSFTSLISEAGSDTLARIQPHFPTLKLESGGGS